MVIIINFMNYYTYSEIMNLDCTDGDHALSYTVTVNIALVADFNFSVQKTLNLQINKNAAKLE